MTLKKTALIPLDAYVKLKIPYAKEILNHIGSKRIPFSSGHSYLEESRYKTSEQIIKQGKFKQVIEIGSGFTPHSLNLYKGVKKYIEIDLKRNIKTKKKIIKKIQEDNNIEFVSGNVFKRKTWKKLIKKLDKIPTAIFCEGFIQYTTKKQRKYFFEKISKILHEYGGVFFFEDSPRFHPEINHFNKLSNKMSKLGKTKELLATISQENFKEEFESYGFKIERIPAETNLISQEYDKTGKEILSKFKFWVLSV